MKKIFTLIFALALLSTAGFAQKRHSDDKNNKYGYTTPFDHSWEKRKHDKNFGDYHRGNRDRDDRYYKNRKNEWYKHHRFYVREDRVKPRKKLSIKLIFGGVSQF